MYLEIEALRQLRLNDVTRMDHNIILKGWYSYKNEIEALYVPLRVHKENIVW